MAQEIAGGHLVTVDYPYSGYGISREQAAEIFTSADQHVGEEAAALREELERARRDQTEQTLQQKNREITLRHVGSQALIDVQRGAVRVTSEFTGAMMKEATDIATEAARKVVANVDHPIEFPVDGHPSYLVKPMEAPAE